MIELKERILKKEGRMAVYKLKNFVEELGVVKTECGSYTTLDGIFRLEPLYTEDKLREYRVVYCNGKNKEVIGYMICYSTKEGEVFIDAYKIVELREGSEKIISFLEKIINREQELERENVVIHKLDKEEKEYYVGLYDFAEKLEQYTKSLLKKV